MTQARLNNLSKGWQASLPPLPTGEVVTRLARAIEMGLSGRIFQLRVFLFFRLGVAEYSATPTMTHYATPRMEQAAIHVFVIEPSRKRNRKKPQYNIKSN